MLIVRHIDQALSGSSMKAPIRIGLQVLAGTEFCPDAVKRGRVGTRPTFSWALGERGELGGGRG